MPDRDQVFEHFVGILRSLDEDDDGDEITRETYLIGNMNWRSVEIVYLANEVQEHYGQTFPFNDLFQEVAEREVQDITVGEWVDFIHENLAPSDAGAKDAEKRASSS